MRCSLTAGDLVVVVEDHEDGWVDVVNEDGERGLVPSNYLTSAVEIEDKAEDTALVEEAHSLAREEAATVAMVEAASVLAKREKHHKTNDSFEVGALEEDREKVSVILKGGEEPARPPADRTPRANDLRIFMPPLPPTTRGPGFISPYDPPEEARLSVMAFDFEATGEGQMRYFLALSFVST